MAGKLTHLDETGAAHMVDVGDKPASTRTAVAEARLEASNETIAAILKGNLKKGDALGVARVAGIMAAKKTADLIPLCHPLALSKVSVEIEPAVDKTALIVTATVRTTGQTGVEMEALTAANVGALTLYDMAKALQRDMVISGVRLLEKTGGTRGDYRHDAKQDTT